MKKGLGVVFIIAMVFGLGLLLFSDRIEFQRDEARVKLAKAYREIDKQEGAMRRGIAEGNVAYEESSNNVEALEAQAKAEYINSLKDIFDKNKHLLDSGENTDVSIDLKKFKQGDEYHFDDLFWNITFEQVENGLEVFLLEDPNKTLTSDGYTYYDSNSKYVLYGKEATATFGFYDDQLKSVQLNFTPGEKQKRVQAFFESIVETLVDIYGKESAKTEDNTAGQVAYQWKADDTMLEVRMANSYVNIWVGMIEAQDAN